MRKPSTNPFYVAALPVGVLFVITACAYAVMTVQGLDPQRGQEGGLVGLLAKHGTMIFVVELAVLGLLTFAAIATDDFWSRSSDSRIDKVH
jgi:hypothetical protein